MAAGKSNAVEAEAEILEIQGLGLSRAAAPFTTIPSHIPRTAAPEAGTGPANNNRAGRNNRGSRADRHNGERGGDNNGRAHCHRLMLRAAFAPRARGAQPLSRTLRRRYPMSSLQPR